MVQNITLTATQRKNRATNVAANDSAAPAAYSPLTPPSSIYTHASHAAQYGAGRRYGIGIRALILHTTEGDNFINSLTYNAWRPEQVSSSAHAGQAGELGFEIEDENRPWTTGRWNDESLTLEINGRASSTASVWRSRPDQMEAITQWIVAGCQNHDIPPTWLTPEQFAEGASLASESPLRAGTRRGIIDHRGANIAAISLGHDPAKYSHVDIGTGLRTVVYEDILPEAARRLNVTPERPKIMDFNLVFGGNTLLLPDAAPVRIADSRTGLTLPQGLVQPGVVRIPIPHPGQPAPKAAVVNVTTVNGAAPGFAKVWGLKSGDGSNANWVTNAPADPSPAIALVGGYETIAIEVVGGAVHLIIDLMAIIC